MAFMKLPLLSAAAICAALSTAGERIVAYRSFQKEPAMTTEFARMGYNTRCFLAGNTLNSIGTPYCEYRPIWLGEGKYDFAAFDEQVDDLLAANPSADFVCIVDLNTPPWLARKFACDSFAEITHIGFNVDWRRITDKWLCDFVAHAEAKCGSRIRAYLLSGGGTSEWYEFDKGRSSRAKNAAWREWCKVRGVKHGDAVPDEASLSHAAFDGAIYDPATEGDKIDYWRFHNSIPADAVLHFASVARRIVPKNRQIGVFFGYYHVQEGIQVSFGHLDYIRVFDSPDIDFIVAPGIYADRAVGGGSGTQTVIGSIQLRGKWFMHEIDFWPHSRKGPGTIGGYFKTQADDIAGNTRESAFAMVNHAGWWWFDMWGGFYDDPVLRERIQRIGEIERGLADGNAKSESDVLLVADPESVYYANEKCAKTRAFGQYFARMTSRSGFVTDVYSFDDLVRIDLSRYKVVLLPATLFVDGERERLLRERVCCGGRTVVWVYAPGVTDGKTINADRVRKWAGVAFGTPGISATDMGGWRAVYAYDHRAYTPGKLHCIFESAGAHAFTDSAIAVFANSRMLSVHCADGGRAEIRLPRRAIRVTDLISGEVVAEGVDRFWTELASPDTKIFGTEYGSVGK